VTDRNSALAAIHIAKKDLGMEDEVYRAFLQEHTGKSSAKEMNPKEHIKVIRAFEEKGFVRKRRQYDKEAYIRLIKKLWHQVSRANDEPLALRRRIFKYHHVTELEQLSIEQLREIYADLQRACRGWRRW
jgi:phage gp16-like protein